MIQLHHGSIFDSKCDMIVIPCNSWGGISKSVYNELLAHDLPKPNSDVALSGVYFLENISRFTSASIIAYAAAVNVGNISNTASRLRMIAQRILKYSREKSLQKINIPLLGTGTGHLSAEDSYNILNEVFGADPRIVLCIYAFSEKHYDDLISRSRARPKQEEQVIKPPRVFISYTGTDPDHRHWVREFACRLRNNGVDARIDMFHLRPGQDLHQWMTNEVIMADKVLLICDKYYAEKADTRRSGVGWETMIILGDMLSAQEQTKYIGIIRGKDIDQSLPIYVRSKYCLNWTDDKQVEQDFENLVLYLYDCDIEPPISPTPDYVKAKLRKNHS